MKETITIRKIENGYLIEGIGATGKIMCFKTLEEVLQELLFIYEGRSKHFISGSYGEVIVTRGKETT